MFVVLAALGMALGAAACGGRTAAEEELRGDELGFLIREATAWVGDQRDLHRAESRPLAAVEKERLMAYFPTEVVAAARVRSMAAIHNPEFFAVYERAGMELPMDFRSAIGLALGDTVLLVDSGQAPGSPRLLSVLFHELVHLTQYRLLGGIEPYIERYVREWQAHGRGYRSNPFEAQAFELQRRFRSTAEPFSVADEVRERFLEVGDHGS